VAPGGETACFAQGLSRPQAQSRARLRHYPVENWLAAFERLAPRATVLNITGGEPFLDRANFHALLEGLTAMEHVKSIRIDTNVSWKTEHYRDIDWTKLSLNASYHPSQTTLERFTASVHEKLDAGVRIVMANYVLDPRRLDHFADVEAAMRELGVFVNANVFIETRGIQQRAEARALYERYIPERDVKMKTGEIVPQGHPCRFPQFAYELKPTGIVTVGCHPKRIGHFITGALPARFTGPSPCPYRYCACLDMYCFLDEAKERGLEFDLLAEYVALARAHRAADNARGDA
jgi:organic radical activating enzyme